MTSPHHSSRLGMGPRIRQPRRPFLPLDAPPRPTSAPPATLQGLSWEADFGLIHTPVPRPFTQYSSPTFPLTHSSNVGPAFIAPRYGFSTNTYSPVPHRLGGVLMESRPAVPVQRPNYAGRGRGALGRSTGRIRGAVAPYPTVNPTWRSMFGGRVE